MASTHEHLVVAAISTPLPVENRSTGKGPKNTRMCGGQLPAELRHDGFDLHLVMRKGRVAIYEQSKGNYRRWEIIRIRTRSGRHLPGGKFLPAHEQYPTAAEWGILGWTAMTLGDAKTRFDKLVKRHDKTH